MENIITELLKNKPSIGQSTLKTYKSVLSTTNSKEFENKLTISMILEKPKEILSSIKDMPISKKRTFLSILVNITSNNAVQDIYRKEMIEQTDSYMNEKNQIPKKERGEFWTSKDEILKIYKELEKRVKCLEKLEELTLSEIELYQQYIILSVLGGIFIPVRRLMDFTKFKINKIDESKDNYLKKNKMIFNTYKTSSTYGEQIIKIPKKLQNILEKWIEINPTDYLLFNQKLEPLSESRLNQILHKIFGGRKISVDILRSVYLEDIYPKDLPKAQKLKDIATMMGHSIPTAIESYL
jgi:hypothetical protein